MLEKGLCEPFRTQRAKMRSWCEKESRVLAYLAFENKHVHHLGIHIRRCSAHLHKLSLDVCSYRMHGFADIVLLQEEGNRLLDMSARGGLSVIRHSQGWIKMGRSFGEMVHS